MKKTLIKFWFSLRYHFSVASPLHLFAVIDRESSTALPGEYTWSERYILKIQYLKRRSEGEDVTFESVENEHLDKWAEKAKVAMGQTYRPDGLYLVRTRYDNLIGSVFFLHSIKDGQLVDIVASTTICPQPKLLLSLSNCTELFQGVIRDTIRVEFDMEWVGTEYSYCTDCGTGGRHLKNGCDHPNDCKFWVHKKSYMSDAVLLKHLTNKQL